MLKIKTVGTSSNRDGIGAKVSVRTAGGVTLWSLVKTGSSYCSQSELPLTFGLGKADKAASVEIAWPSGHKETIADVAANQSIVIQEGKAIISSQPISLGGPSGETAP
jgi:enediyne biosynthesis protein E4